MGTIIGVTLTERMRRQGTRREHLLTHSLMVYAELLTVAARLVDNTRDWAFAPLEDLKQADAEDLNRLIGRVRVVASPKVFDAFLDLNTRVQDFHRVRELDVAPYHRLLRDEGRPDDERSRAQRQVLGEKAGAVADSYKRIEATIRADVGWPEGSA